MLGKLYLFPVSLGNDDLSLCLPQMNATFLNECRTFIVEDLRSARRFLKKAGYQASIDETEFLLLNKHTSDDEIYNYLNVIEKGGNIGLLSEAGLPCIADPGAMVVRLAQQKKIEVIPLVGPSSLLLALMASGFNGQNFAFVGYLPIDKHVLTKRIKELEHLVYTQKQTQIFIETPYRNNQLLASLLEICSGETMICIATDITLPTQSIISKSVSQWKKKLPELHKRNTVFLLGN